MGDPCEIPSLYAQITTFPPFSHHFPTIFPAFHHFPPFFMVKSPTSPQDAANCGVAFAATQLPAEQLTAALQLSKYGEDGLVDFGKHGDTGWGPQSIAFGCLRSD
jgi:hypothetical protein